MKNYLISITLNNPDPTDRKTTAASLGKTLKNLAEIQSLHACENDTSNISVLAKTTKPAALIRAALDGTAQGIPGKAKKQPTGLTNADKILIIEIADNPGISETGYNTLKNWLKN